MDRTEIRLRIVEAFLRSDRHRDTWVQLADDVDHFEAIVLDNRAALPLPAEAVVLADGLSDSPTNQMILAGAIAIEDHIMEPGPVQAMRVWCAMLAEARKA